MKYFPFLLFIFCVACSQTHTETYKTMNGQFLSKTSLDSLIANDYIVHYLDTIVSGDSTIYSIYHYHESAKYADPRKRHVGRQLPAFDLTDLAGNQVNSASFAGKPMMINFWSVACKPCIIEMPILNELEANFGNEVTILGVASEDKESVERILRKHPSTLQQIPGSENYMVEIGIRTYPTSFFINSSGEIVEVIEGTPTEVDESNPSDANLKSEIYEAYASQLTALTTD